MSIVHSWSAVEQFEKRMAAYCGASYAVAVDTCTAALFLCFKRLNAKVVTLPTRTYLGVACAAIHAGAKVTFEDDNWKGSYAIEVDDWCHLLSDSACRLRKGMCYENPRMFTCLSFQYRKHLKIGRGGMILTNEEFHADWFRKARFCGRAEVNGVPEFVGWHCYMEPERAARGLVLMDSLLDNNEDLQFNYPNLQDYEVLR
jgi:dTDP-4-amino-4,6-dideoxygalactose transaminase